MIEERIEMTALSDDLGFLLSRTSGLLIQVTNAALAGHGLRVRQYSVLVLACDAPDGMSQRDLAAALGLDPSQVVQLVDELERARLVERRASPFDRRTRLVVATRAGRRVRREAATRTAAGQRGPLGVLEEHERATLRELLTRVLDGAEEGQTSA
jgi:DNA-binding MarR family transcriptional regulator